MPSPGNLLTALWELVMPPGKTTDTVIVNYVTPADGHADTNGLYLPVGTSKGGPMIRLYRLARSCP